MLLTREETSPLLSFKRFLIQRQSSTYCFYLPIVDFDSCVVYVSINGDYVFDNSLFCCVFFFLSRLSHSLRWIMYMLANSKTTLAFRHTPLFLRTNVFFSSIQHKLSSSVKCLFFYSSSSVLNCWNLFFSSECKQILKIERNTLMNHAEKMQRKKNSIVTHALFSAIYDNSFIDFLIIQFGFSDHFSNYE